MKRPRYYHRSNDHYTPTLQQIAKMFLLPILNQKPEEVRDEDFLDYIFNTQGSVVKTYICTKQGEVSLFAAKSATTDYETPQTTTLTPGDLVTARRVEGRVKIDIEIDREGKIELFRTLPSKWPKLRRLIESRDQLNFRAGVGHDTIKRNITKLVNRGLTLDAAARITYVLAGRIKG